MEEELKIIVSKMDEFSKKYNCKIEIETYESSFIGDSERRTVYKLKAIKPEEILTEIIV